MKTLIVLIAVLLLLAGGLFGYLVLTTPSAGHGVAFPLSADERALLSYVPRDAGFFAIVPTVSVTRGKLEKNPVTRDAVAQWAASHQMPSGWMLGGADLVIWKSERETSYAIRLDPIRAMLVHLYLMIGGDSDSHTDANFRINSSAPDPLGPAELAELEPLFAKLPAGDLFAVQRESARGAFPPIDRPAVSSMQISPDAITITSHADNPDGQPAGQPVSAPFARNALMTAWFAHPPRAADDLNRLFGARVTTLLSDGGRIVLYDVATNTLLPRPKGLFVLPATDERRQAVAGLESIAPQEVRDALGVKIERGERDGDLLVAFDDSSIPEYQKDALDQPAWPANSWSLRADPQRLAPLLEKLGSSTGLRIAAPRLFRSARDLGRWLGALRQAHSIEAADSIDGGIEELRVRILTH